MTDRSNAARGAAAAPLDDGEGLVAFGRYARAQRDQARKREERNGLTPVTGGQQAPRVQLTFEGDIAILAFVPVPGAANGNTPPAWRKIYRWDGTSYAFEHEVTS